MRKIEIDCKKAMNHDGRSYNFCVGGGRAFETLLAENLRHLKIVHDDCGFQYLR
jgi:xylan 1,4-beta-xylosidase